MRNTPVDRIMTTDPATITPDTSVAAAREMLEFGELHHLPVVDNGRLAGIVSSADLLKLYLVDGGLEKPSAVTVSSIMEDSPVTLAMTATLREAAEKLSYGGFHALPVVDEDRRLAGIITSTDLNLYLLRHLPRGDGSLREAPAREGSASLSDARFAEALTALKAAPAGDPVVLLANALLAERRPLADVQRAAELYFRSGQAEREHSVLLKALAAARRIPNAVDL